MTANGYLAKHGTLFLYGEGVDGVYIGRRVSEKDCRVQECDDGRVYLRVPAEDLREFTAYMTVQVSARIPTVPVQSPRDALDVKP